MGSIIDDDDEEEEARRYVILSRTGLSLDLTLSAEPLNRTQPLQQDGMLGRSLESGRVL